MNKGEINNVLWDIKEEERDSLPVDFLIKRVLVCGGVLLIKDILQNYEVGKVKEVLYSLKVSEVGEKRYNFLKNYLFI